MEKSERTELDDILNRCYNGNIRCPRCERGVLDVVGEESTPDEIVFVCCNCTNKFKQQYNQIKRMIKIAARHLIIP